MRNYDYGINAISASSSSSTSGSLIAFIVAIAASIVIYFVFMDKKEESKYTGFVKNLYDFLHFKINFIEAFLKIAYITTTLYVTITSFSLIKVDIALFFMVLILGNIIIRILYEAAFLLYNIYLNTKEINSKLK
ncbi:putative uncharacterized protein [Coprobacillus sp. CAG:605]|nr:putative uncharacterized protein [Coprobacillus sp. CAG:605]